MLQFSFKPNILRGQGVLSVKGSMSLLPACQPISSCSRLLPLSEITVERDFGPLHAVMISKILDFSVCWLISFSPEGLRSLQYD